MKISSSLEPDFSWFPPNVSNRGAPKEAAPVLVVIGVDCGSYVNFLAFIGKGIKSPDRGPAARTL